ncbi:RNA polymerase sigma factor [Desulfuribacillus alkaliarsenatis]|uniref:RNA polymerase subunit sigma n=1 Tax=Desulfuribacillus alkaliarsenatis TaxID=766136 RepID=A0A1E5FYN2_9FIRM|nr:sigma-70 family RNA polymerase sigma factor [Desulfuribacillus alkaliarsenatis]OEF95684.1 hypothetical protein BHF68_11295 [Desulfuribacillus alkaliarsenatis]
MVSPGDDLLNRLKANDEAAYAEIVTLYGDRILHLAYTIVGDRQLAVDVVQETFIGLYEKLYTFKGDSSLYTWLVRVALNKAKNKVRPSFFKKITYLWDIKATDASPLPEEIIEKKDRHEQVREVLTSLPIKYRDVLYLHYYEELKIYEIAEILDVSDSAIKSRLARGREQLQKILVDRGLQ